MAVLLADLVQDLKGSLKDAWNAFDAPDNADWVRHLTAAAQDFGRVRPATMAGSLSLEEGVSDYPAPAGFVRFKLSLWSSSQTRTPKPWEKTWCGPFPRVHVADGLLVLDPAPTAQQIAILGSEYRFFYYAGLVVGAAESTVQESERGLLILRAQAEAMRELAMRGVTRPTSTRDGYSGTPREGSPAVLAREFLAEFERRAAVA
jgi:hypothetical protein